MSTLVFKAIGTPNFKLLKTNTLPDQSSNPVLPRTILKLPLTIYKSVFITASSWVNRPISFRARLPPKSCAPSPLNGWAIAQRIELCSGRVPGLTSASFSAVSRLSDSQWASGIAVVGVTIPEGDPCPLRNAFGPNFFTTIGARLTEGRDFAFADNSPTAPKVAIVNQSFARRYLGGASAIGRIIGPASRDTKPNFTIEGVVAYLRDARIE